MDDESTFHPCNTPRGTLYYNLDTLTDDQQEELNDLKVNIVRDNYKYLAAHPEIRAVIQLILRYVLCKRPMHNIPAFIAKIFTLPDVDLEEIVNNYIKENNLEKKASRETVTLTTTDRETTSGSSEIFRDTDTDEKDKSVSDATDASLILSVRSNVHEIQDKLIIDYLKTLYTVQLDEKTIQL